MGEQKQEEAYERPLTEREAARLIGVSRMTLIRARRRGEVPYLQVGNSVRYLPSQLRAAVSRPAQACGSFPAPSD